MIAEFPPVGGVVTSYHLEPIRTDTTTGGMYFLLLLFYIVGTYYFLVECIDMYMRSTQLYSITLWNIVDTFNYAVELIFFLIFLNLYFTTLNRYFCTLLLVNDYCIDFLCNKHC